MNYIFNTLKLIKFNFGFRRILLWISWILALILIFEALGSILLRSIGYKSVTWEITGNTFITESTLKECDYLSTISPHPYLGFAHYPGNKCIGDGINSLGFIDTRVPPLYKTRNFDVLVVGGSVAAQIAFGGYLKEALDQECETESNVFNAADGSYKQPQQVIAMSLFSQGVDAVVSIEGFNEHYAFLGTEPPALENISSNYPWAIANLRNRVLVNVVTKTRNMFQDTPVMSNSRFINSIFLLSVKLINNLIQEDLTKNANLYTYNDRNIEDSKKSNMYKYKDYLRLMIAIAESRDQEFFMFIQPVPALGKFLTKREELVVGNLQYGEVYTEIKNELMEINSFSESKQYVSDLTNVYENVSSDIYGDPIHALQENGSSLGYEIMSRKIAQVICKKT